MPLHAVAYAAFIVFNTHKEPQNAFLAIDVKGS